MEVYAEYSHVMTLTHHELGIALTLIECDEQYQVKCPQHPEFEEVTLGRTREDAGQEFIDFFFAIVGMIQDTDQERLPHINDV